MPDQIESGVGVLKLKLGACLTAPTAKFHAELLDVCKRANVARNAMVRFFERWREDHEWQPDPLVKKDGTPRTFKGRALVRNDPLPRINDQTPVMALYNAGREAVPDISTRIISACSNEVHERLRSNVPYNHPGTATYRWQAVLANEFARDCYRSLALPVLCNSSSFVYEGACSREGTGAATLHQYRSQCVLVFPMWSKQSGRTLTSHIVRLEVGQLSPGNREVLRKIARREWKFSDSEIVGKEKVVGGKIKTEWYLHMVYRQPRAQVDWQTDNPGILSLLPADASHPLALSADNLPLWKMGRVRLLEWQYAQLANRRAVLKNQYRLAGSGSRGHGRQRFNRDLRIITRNLNNLCEDFGKQLCAEALRYCERYQVGKIVYREPSLILRQKDWFSRRNIPFDWTGFESRLKHKLWIAGVELEVQRMGMKEHRECSGNGSARAAASSTR